MGAVEITPVAGSSELEAFVALPYALHWNDTGFTPPLRRDVRTQLDCARNPFFAHATRELYLARSGGRVAGRIAAIHDDAHGPGKADELLAPAWRARARRSSGTPAGAPRPTSTAKSRRLRPPTGTPDGSSADRPRDPRLPGRAASPTIRS